MIIDDHPIIHDGLKNLLENEPDLSVAEGAFSSSEALEKLEVVLPDLAVVDLSLGDSDGTYLIQRIKSRHPKLRILVYSMSEEKLFAERVSSAGAVGYVMKTESSECLKEAIRQVLNGDTYFSKTIMTRFEKKQAGKGDAYSNLLDILSNREMDVLKLVGLGLDTVHIASKLNISRNTADTHRINIKNKLELPNGKALDRMAYTLINTGRLVVK